MRQMLESIEIETAGRGFYDATAALARVVAQGGIRDGLLTVFIRHTSASLTVQENADPAVLADLTSFLERLAPEGAGYRHDEEGPDDMPAHIRSMVTATQIAIPVIEGRLALGTWQAVYVVEHRRAPHRRSLALHLIGS